MTHSDASDLLASFALDAVTSEEHTEIEAHLLDCPRCRAELDGYRDVAAAMGNTVEPLPDGLWSSISSRLPERSDAEPPPMPRLAGPDHPDDTPSIPLRHRPRMGRGALATVGSFAVAAAAAAAVLGIGLFRADNRVTADNAALHAQSSNAIVSALKTPGHKVVNLQSHGHHRLAQFVLETDGRGYLVKSSLPALSSSHVYQLWAIVNKQPISLGLLGSSPHNSTFTMSGALASRLSITVEPSVGSTAPTSPPVASGAISA